MEDVLEVYQRPYDEDRPVVCMDEKPVTLHSDVIEGFRRSDGSYVYDNQYERHGTCSAFMFVEPLTGWRRAVAHATRTKRDWAEEVARLVEEDFPEAERIVLVMDNLNTHTLDSLYEAFPAERASAIARRLEVHYTPEHGSWLNIAEIALSALSNQCLGVRRFPTVEALNEEMTAWYNHRNSSMKQVDWQFTAEDARIKLKHLYPKIN